MEPRVQAFIEDKIGNHEVVLFMKGTRRAPACGFSGRTVELLDSLLDEYETVDVLADPEVREGLKEFSSWPTLPQLYVRGKFVGGADIIAQSFEEGSLDQMLGLPERGSAPPELTVTDRALEELRRYLAGSGDHVIIEVDAAFQTGLSLGPAAPSMVTVRVADVPFSMDRLSASRSHGSRIDYVETTNGGAFKIDNPSEPPKVKQLTVSTLKAWQDRGDAFRLIDVRTPGEWQTARIEGAELLDDELKEHLLGLPKDTKLVFQCHHGHRSQRAAQHFVGLGFREVFNLVGGIDAWSIEIDGDVPRY